MRMKYKRFLFLLADIAIVTGSYWLAALLRYEGAIPADAMQGLMLYTSIAVFAAVLLSVIFGCYDSLWRYAGFETVFRQGIVAVLSTAVLFILKYSVFDAMSGSIALIYGILMFMLTSVIRVLLRFAAWFKSLYLPSPNNLKHAVIIGAGNTGATIIKQSRETPNSGKFSPVAVIDNDPAKIGLKICGVKVVGDIDSVEQVCKTYRAKEIIVALPNATKDELYNIYRKCIKTNLPIRSSQNFVNVKDYLKEDNIALKHVTIEDLLFRDVIANDMSVAKEFIKGNVVMVTGGAGSIGSEICRQALLFGCKYLIVYDFSEIGLYEIDEGLNDCLAELDKSRYKLCLGSVRDVQRLQEVMETYKPDIVFHAAAHKHVPMMEMNPFEAIKNNVLGTMNVIETCIQNKVRKFILISTDKAVNPANIMGASKRIAEMLVKTMNNRGTELAAVRFGNVLGSNGSVIPKFKRQIAEGGPVTLTHKDMIRYFMTIPEAVGLVLTAGAYAKGGEVFVLDMGHPIKIYDLAADLIRLSGYEPEKDINIKVTGLRPGEKLYEELFLSDETIDKTTHEKIFVLKGDDAEDFEDLEDFKCRLDRVIMITKEGKNENLLREAVFGLVNENRNIHKASSQGNEYKPKKQLTSI